MKRPLDVLNNSRGKSVLVVIRGNKEYHGVLDGYDSHMNLVLKNVEEITYIQETGEQKTASYVFAIIRGDNVIYISPSE